VLGTCFASPRRTNPDMARCEREVVRLDDSFFFFFFFFSFLFFGTNLMALDMVHAEAL
jgi:hypothetical protein